jgi:protein TonB
VRALVIAAAVLCAGAAAGAGPGQVAEVAAVVPVEDAAPASPGLAERLAAIRERIQAALEYPPLARLDDTTGSVVVRFEIDAQGAASEVRVVRSSGSPRLDAAALRAVREAGELPRVGGPLEVPVHFALVPR